MVSSADPILARSAATQIVSKLRDAGHTAYFAGGCVRDELLGLSPTDYDVATDATPDRVTSIFPRALLVGVAFGVVRVPLPEATVEVATFRSDGPYSDSRRPDVIHFSDPASDAKRRDFTINALFLDPLAPADVHAFPLNHPARGKVHDFVGGVADLQERVVRAVGDPEQRLAEDHLRALRAVRFAARLGFRLDESTAQAISRHAADLRGVSRERIGEEVRRMLLHSTRADAAALLQSLGLDGPVLDGPHLAPELPTLRAIQATAASDGIPYHTSLAAWALDRSAGELTGSPAAVPPPRSRKARSQLEGLVGVWRHALKLSNDERDQFAGVLGGYEGLRATWIAAGEAEQKRAAAQPWFDEALRLVTVREPQLGSDIAARVQELRETPSGIAPEPYITGDDLLAAGLAAGPRFKQILDMVYDAQLEGRVCSKVQAMELARGLCV